MFRNRVDGHDVLDNVDDESRVHIGVEEEHVADAAVGDRRTKDRNVVLGAPVVHRLLVVDPLSQELDHLGRGPDHSLCVRRGLHTHLLLLLLQHVIKNGHHPVFKVAVIVVGNDEISCAIQTLQPKITTIQIELPNEELPHALNEVLFDASAGCHDYVN